MSQTNYPETTLRSERTLPFTAEEVYDAFAQGEQLAQWWGPNGFTNTFEQFDFTTGGRWVFVMHGPNGADYPNESIFTELRPKEKIVIEHLCQPHFFLTITLTPQDGGTHIVWSQEFDDPQIAAAVRRLNANEENLDRLEAVLARGREGS